jgi:hypothetical protein
MPTRCSGKPFLCKRVYSPRPNFVRSVGHSCVSECSATSTQVIEVEKEIVVDRMALKACGELSRMGRLSAWDTDVELEKT